MKNVRALFTLVLICSNSTPQPPQPHSHQSLVLPIGVAASALVVGVGVGYKWASRRTKQYVQQVEEIQKNLTETLDGNAALASQLRRAKKTEDDLCKKLQQEQVTNRQLRDEYSQKIQANDAQIKQQEDRIRELYSQKTRISTKNKAQKQELHTIEEELEGKKEECERLRKQWNGLAYYSLRHIFNQNSHRPLQSPRDDVALIAQSDFIITPDLIAAVRKAFNIPPTTIDRATIEEIQD